MTVESNPVIISRTSSRASAARSWTPKAHRRGEPLAWADEARPAEASEPEMVFPSLSTPPVHWPRVFPSL
jgi:hypothetical protein